MGEVVDILEKKNKRNVLQYYREIAARAISFSDYPRYGVIVLKTDCHNEAYGEFPIVPWIEEQSDLKHNCTCFLLEYDEKVIEDALKRFPNLSINKGDIRKIPFDDKSFEIILDFSTIDHSGEYTLVLDEYNRVLDKKGIISIVVWLDNVFRHDPSPTDTGQYYFQKQEFLEEFENRFELIEVEYLPWALGNIGTGCLTRFLGRKKDVCLGIPIQYVI